MHTEGSTRLTPDAAGDNTPTEPSLVLSHDSSVNYAFQQNAIPIVKVLQFKNNGIERKDIIIRISTEPGFATELTPMIGPELG